MSKLTTGIATAAAVGALLVVVGIAEAGVVIVGPVPPNVTYIAPSVGEPGTRVRVIGASLEGATAVHFGSASAAFTPVSAIKLEATAPPGTGTVQVTVTTPAGTSRAGGPGDNFTYGPPSSLGPPGGFGPPAGTSPPVESSPITVVETPPPVAAPAPILLPPAAPTPVVPASPPARPESVCHNPHTAECRAFRAMNAFERYAERRWIVRDPGGGGLSCRGGVRREHCTLSAEGPEGKLEGCKVTGTVVEVKPGTYDFKHVHALSSCAKRHKR